MDYRVIILALLPVFVFGQNVNLDKVNARQNITLRGNRIDSFSIDRTFASPSNNEIATQKAVYDYISGIVSGLAYLPVTGGTLTGTGGAGFVGFPAQSSAPSTPSSGFRFYADASGRLSWKGTNGFVRVFDGTANTADRAYTLPDASGIFNLIDVAQTITAIKTFSPSGSGGAGFIYSSTTRPSHPIPNMTTAQMNALSGQALFDVVANTTTGRYNYWNGSAWVEMPSVAAGGVPNTLIPFGDALNNLTTNANFFLNTSTSEFRLPGKIKINTNTAGVVEIGFGATAGATGNAAVVIGPSASAASFGYIAVPVVIGSSAASSGNASTVVGGSAKSFSADGATSIGAFAETYSGFSVAIGKASVATGSNQFVAGSTGNGTSPITEVYFGSGIQRRNPIESGGQTNGAGASYGIYGSGGLGIDQAGGNLTLGSGKGTGAGAPGVLIFSTPSVLASGSTLQSLVERMRITGAGFLGLGTPTPAAQFNTAGNISAASWTTNGIGIRIDNATYTNTTSSGTVARQVAHRIGQPTFTASSATVIDEPVNFYIAGNPTLSTNVTLGFNGYALYVDGSGVNGNSLTTRVNGSVWAAKDGRYGSAFYAQLAFSGTEYLLKPINATNTGPNVGVTLGTSPISSSANSIGLSNLITVGSGNVDIQESSGGAINLRSGSIRLFEHAASQRSNINMGAGTAHWFHLGGTNSGGFLQLSPQILPHENSGNGWVFRSNGGTFTGTEVTGTTINASSHSFGVSTIASTNARTFTNIANVKIDGAPIASTNTTFTNPLALWVVGGNTSLGGRLGVGTVTPTTSSLVEFSSTTQGLLIPRATTAQITAVASPALALQMFSTTDERIHLKRTDGFYQVAYTQDIKRDSTYQTLNSNLDLSGLTTTFKNRFHTVRIKTIVTAAASGNNTITMPVPSADLLGINFKVSVEDTSGDGDISVISFGTDGADGYLYNGDGTFSSSLNAFPGLGIYMSVAWCQAKSAYRWELQ